MRKLKHLPLPDILATMAAPHSPYAEIDPTVARWTATHGLELCREWQGEARFWYTSRGNECFQVVIAQPSNGWVKLEAWSIETDDDADLHEEWLVATDDIERGLGLATDLIDQWSLRTRTVR